MKKNKLKRKKQKRKQKNFQKQPNKLVLLLAYHKKRVTLRFFQGYPLSLYVGK